MGHFHFANYSKKIISIVLLMIIFTTTISYTAIDIDALYIEVISENAFITKLYETGATLEVPLSNDEILLFPFLKPLKSNLLQLA